MAWSPLATQFCLELAFGVLLFLALMPRAPMGVFFWRMMGVTALIPLLAAGVMSALYGELAWSDSLVVASLAPCLGFPLFAGSGKAERRLLEIGRAHV